VPEGGRWGSPSPPAASNSYILRNGFTWRWSNTPLANFQPSATFGEPLNAAAPAKCDPL
jgi:hypothetical protein